MMRPLWCWLLLLSFVVVTGCIRRYPPVAFVDRTVEIYPDPRPTNCQLMIFSAPPARPHRVFAQVRSYGSSEKAVEKMRTLLKEKACEEGADGLVLLPVEQEDHILSDAMYPDSITSEKTDIGYGGRFERWVDKHYVISQKGYAIVFKRDAAKVKSSQPGS